MIMTKQGNKNMSLRALLLIKIFFAITASAPAYTPAGVEQRQAVVSSESRLVFGLEGNWEASYTGDDFTTLKAPYSDPSGRKLILRRNIKLSRSIMNDMTWHLYFPGAEHQVEIYINEKFVGKYLGAMTPFKVRIPEKMIAGENNSLKLIISPTANATGRIQSRYIFAKKVYTGLLRNLYLIGTPSVWIEELNRKIELKAGGADISAEVNISTGQVTDMLNAFISDTLPDAGKPNSVSVSIELIDVNEGLTVAEIPSRTILLENERTISEKFNLSMQAPKLWTPESPYLYSLKAVISKNGRTIDEISKTVGFRSITTGNGEIQLNGRPFALNAVTYIEDYEEGGQTLDYNRMEKDIKNIKTLGANTIRFKFNPPHPYMLHLCDKYGIFAMIDLPAYDVPVQLIALDEIKVQMSNLARQYLTAYDGHPALFGWGVYDGVPQDSRAEEKFSSSIIKIFKEASKAKIYKIVSFGSDTLLTKGFDLLGFKDHKQKRPWQEIESRLTELKEQAGGLPVFFSYGIPVQPDNHNGFSDPLSLEFQAFYIKNSWSIAKELGLAGNMINSYNDYLLNHPLLITDNEDQYLCATGLVSRDRQQRLSFKTLQSLFNMEKEPLLNAGSHSEKTPVSYIIFGLLLLVIIVVLSNSSRRFREYLFRSVLRPYNFYADIRDQRIMSFLQTLLLGIVIAFSLGIFLSSIFYYYRTDIISQYIYIQLLTVNELRELFFNLVWMPELSLLVIALLYLAMLFIVSGIIKVFAFFLRARIFFADAFTLSVWSAVPMLLVLPIGIVLIRVLVLSDALISIVLLLFGIICLWIFARLLKSNAVVFDKPPMKVYLTGVGVLAVVLGVITGIYQYQYSIFAYAEYFFKIMV